MQDYKSRLSDPASRKFETFSYLPPMTDAEIRKQVEYLVKKGWNPAIEHTEPRYLRRLLLVHVEAADVRRDRRGQACWPKPKPAARPTRTTMCA